MTLAEIASASGIPARTIRFYIARGLLSGPVKGGRGAAYTAEHLASIERIKRLQSEGRTLSEIARMLGGEEESTTSPPSPWWQCAITDDVIVWAKADLSPWRVIYAFPLPRDAALLRFRIVGESFEVHSELKETAEAVKAYEQGIADGSLSALVRQYGDGVVNLTIGNIRPRERVTVYLELMAGIELHDDGFRFRSPFTLAPAYHSRSRAAVVADEGELELPADEFGDVLLPRFRKNASSLHEVGFDLSVLHQLPLDEIWSPSHSIRSKQSGTEQARVTLALESDVPNRDLILDVRFTESKIQVLAGPTGDGKRSFAAIVPSTVFGLQRHIPRRVVILLDRSGSMQGESIARAHKAIDACLATLAEEDSFTLLAFNDHVEALGSTLARATREQRACAHAFLEQVGARGGTELSAGIQQAANILAGEGDIFIITDGQVFGTETVFAQARETGIRVFCLGIGATSQDHFLSLLARTTKGIAVSSLPMKGWSSLLPECGFEIGEATTSPLLERLFKLREATASKDALIELAAMLEPDGGLPGKTYAIRVNRTIAAVFAFVAAGHTLTRGAFRAHVVRLVNFLRSLSISADSDVRLIQKAIQAASSGKAPAGPWLDVVHDVTQWERVGSALK